MVQYHCNVTAEDYLRYLIKSNLAGIGAVRRIAHLINKLLVKILAPKRKEILFIFMLFEI